MNDDAPTPERPAERELVVSVLVMLTALVVAEIFFRQSSLDRAIRKNNHVTAKADEYATVPADVVVTGDSRMFHGVVPSVMTEALRDATGQATVTYNFGIPSGTTPIFLMAAHAAAHHPLKRPRVFVIGVTPALFSCCDAVSAVGTAPGMTASAIPAFVRATWWANTDEAGASVALGASRLLAERTEVIAAFRDLALPAPQSFTSRGWVSIGGRVAPATQDTRARGRAGGYAELMDKSKGAKLWPAPGRLLAAAIRELQSAEVRVAVIGTPQARQLDWYHDGAHTYFEYLDTVKRVTAEAGVPFVDLDDFPGLENIDFVDGDHLNEPGATKFTRYLAATVVAPLLR